SKNFLSFVRRQAIPSLHQSNLNPTRYSRLSIPLPDKYEQQAVLMYLAQQTLSIDRAISRTEREIELIREYRTRLIADVVTGKVDVRGIAVEAVPEEELIEEVEDTEEPVSEEDMVEEEAA